MVFCSYGCGREGIYQLKNRKWCCSKNTHSCPEIAKKSGNSKRKPERQKPEVCDYGCGKLAVYKIGKKWCCSPHYTKCSESRKKASEKSKGRKGYWSGRKREPFSKEWKEQISKFQLGKKNSKKGNGIRGKKFTADHKAKISKSLSGDRNPAKRDSVRKKISNTVKKIWDDKNSYYHTKEYWNNRYIGENRKPNNHEKMITDLLNELFINKYKYVGDFKVFINGKNPDWVHVESKKIIEYFGGYWHDKEITGEDRSEHERNRARTFEEVGYKVLVIWEEELKDIESLKKKLINFEAEKGENNEQSTRCAT